LLFFLLTRRDKKLKKLIGEDDGTQKHVALYKVRTVCAVGSDWMGSGFWCNMA